MAERLVYSPKCWAYIKNTSEEIMDLTEYVIGGEITRRINQVSTAKLTLRNPDKIFTRPGEVAFHPMDPITIFLERTPGHPVQVFTGFLDKSPYIQFRPGPITLEASCTLKKLLYTWYQLAQPYTLSLLEYFGWVQQKLPVGEVIGPGGVEGIEEGQGSELAAMWAEKAGREGFQHSTNGVPFSVEKGGQYATNDGSFANLLWAILTFIGDWQDERIWIEDVPSSVPKLINKLWNDFEQNDKGTQEEINRLWQATIGVSSHGSGGGPGGGEGKGSPTGNLTNVREVVETMTRIAHKYNLPPEFVIATSLSECGFTQSEITGTNSAGATGWFQFTSDEPYPGIKVNFPEDARDTGTATEDFCKAAVMRAVENPSLKAEGNWEEWAVQTQQPGHEAYKSDWAANVAKAKRLVTQYPPKEGGPPLKGGLPEETERNKGETKGKSGSGQTTRLEAMISRASEISNKNYPYAWGGGHKSVGKPSIGEPGGPEGSSGSIGFDCSGSVLAVLAAGEFVPTGSSFGTSGEMVHVYGHIGEPGPSPEGKGVTVYANAEHEWMTINGRYFSTGGSSKNSKGGAGWGGEGAANWGENPGDFESFHLKNSELEEPYTGEPAPALAGTEGETGGPGNEGKGSPEGSILSQATAAAFASNITLPNTIERAKAQIFGGQKALMNSQEVFHFVQQVCEASLRSFQSLPNGDFYAFYPDYFGEFGHHDAYWLIYNIEILDGGVDLNDTNLITHAFSLGNPLYPANPAGILELVQEEKAGVMTIFEAMDSEGILYNLEEEEVDKKRPGVDKLMNNEEAIKFLERYGPRVFKESYPLVTSTIYECLLAYQQFLLGWSRQFETTFLFTFMPELFPGGKVGFPEHGLQMYIEEVTHTWDTTNGYETAAKLTAPSLLQTEASTTIEGEDQLPPNMVEALIEPLRNETKKEATAPKQRPPLPTGQKH